MGAGNSGSGDGAGPVARPCSASSVWKRRASCRCPRSPGCSRSALHMARSVIQSPSHACRCRAPYRSDRACTTVFTARCRRASGWASAPGSPSIVPGSGRHAVSRTAPCSVRAAYTWSSRAATDWMSKVQRRVSLTPTTTEARPGRSSSATGSCRSSTSRVCAPLTARLVKRAGSSTRRTGSSSAPHGSSTSPSASSAAQPRHAPSLTGSPTPSVSESPRATNREGSSAPRPPFPRGDPSDAEAPGPRGDPAKPWGLMPRPGA